MSHLFPERLLERQRQFAFASDAHHTRAGGYKLPGPDWEGLEGQASGGPGGRGER